MENVTEKQLDYIALLTSDTMLDKALKADIREGGTQKVDRTINTFLEWCEGNLDVNSASLIITALENVRNYETDLGHVLELLKDQGYEYR